MPVEPVQFITQPLPLAVDCATACAMLGGISRSTFTENVSRGYLPKPRKLGARSVWLVKELEEFADRLPVSDDTPAPKT